MNTTETTFFVTGGTLRHDAPSYVERAADKELFEGLLKGEFCYVLTSRQMGKSSLMVRTATRLREKGMNVVVLDLTAIGQNVTPEQWYDGLLTRLGRQLHLEDALEEFWRTHARVGPAQRFFSALCDIALTQRAGPLFVFIDESDTVRSLPFSTDEFFAAVRECYNRRSAEPEFNRLTFCLLGVATPSDLIRDTRLTPFNVGRRVELNDFTLEEMAPLARGFSADAATAPHLLERIYYWTGGHPYLTQRLCRAVAEHPDTREANDVDELCDDLFLSARARERDDNLIFVRERLLHSEVERGTLLDGYDKVRKRRQVADDETNPFVSVLKLSGVVQAANGRLRVRNRVYDRVFGRSWIVANLPAAELRRQRAAFKRGVVLAVGLIAAALVLLSLPIFKKPEVLNSALLPDFTNVSKVLFEQATNAEFVAMLTNQNGLVFCVTPSNAATSLNIVWSTNRADYVMNSSVAFTPQGDGFLNGGWIVGAETAAHRTVWVPPLVEAKSSKSLRITGSRVNQLVTNAPRNIFNFSANGTLLTVMKVEGQVEVARAGSQIWDVAYRNQVLQAGDRLRTGMNSWVEVKLADATVLRIGPQSQFEMPRAPQNASGLEILKGVLRYFNREKPEELEIKTPAASSAIKG